MDIFNRRRNTATAYNNDTINTILNQLNELLQLTHQQIAQKEERIEALELDLRNRLHELERITEQYKHGLREIEELITRYKTEGVIYTNIHPELTCNNTQNTNFEETHSLETFVASITIKDGITLSPEQTEVCQKLEQTHDNYFITGKAGTGKSVLLKAFLEYTQKKVVVLAPTGIAALNVSGQTIHSFFGLDVFVQNIHDREQVHKSMSKQRIELLKRLEVIIIDEISMVRSDVMDMIDAKLKIAKNTNLPFGGCQLLCFGDLFQLPPVKDKDTEARRFMDAHYKTYFFFGSSAVISAKFKIVELTHVFRQTETQFIDILNRIRLGRITDSDMITLNKRVTVLPKQTKTISVTCTNSSAERINQERLAEISTPARTYMGQLLGAFEEKDCPAPLRLVLKTGAQVMMLKNDTDKRWVNGTIGKVVKLSENEICVLINGISCSIDKETWSKYEYVYDEQSGKLEKEEVGSFTQFPIKLAYAITIHKSQGQTYDSVIVDYSDCGAFADGQTYVALSRCKSLKTLYLTKPLTREDIKVSQEVIDYMNGFDK